MKTGLRIFILIFLLSTITFTNGNSGSIVKAKYAGEFIATGVGARALGMGGAFVAIANDASAGYWNPAGISHLNYPQLIGMYAERFAKLVNYNYGAVALPTDDRTTFALSIIRLGVDDIPITALPRPDLPQFVEYEYEEDGKIILKRNTPYVAKRINDAEWAFYLSYAKIVSKNFAWGSNVKVVTKQVGDNSAWGLGFDVGFLYRPFRKFNVGVNLQDITTTLLAWDTGRREAITPTLKTGAAYFLDLPLLAGKVIPAFDLDIRFENRRAAAQFNLDRVSFDTHLGLEYEFRHIVAIRAGADVGHFSAGAGIQLPQLNIDYAFLSHDELGDTHRISLMLTLKEEKFNRRK